MKKQSGRTLVVSLSTALLAVIAVVVTVMMRTSDSEGPTLVRPSEPAGRPGRPTSPLESLPKVAERPTDYVELEQVFGTAEKSSMELLRELVQAIRDEDGAKQTTLMGILIDRGEEASNASLTLFMELLDTPLALETKNPEWRISTLTFATLAEIAMRLPEEVAAPLALAPLRGVWRFDAMSEEVTEEVRASFDQADIRPEANRLSQRDRQACSLILGLMCEHLNAVPEKLAELLAEYAAGKHPEEYPDPWISQVLQVNAASRLLLGRRALCDAMVASPALSASLRLQLRLMLQSGRHDLTQLIELLMTNRQAAASALASHFRVNGMKSEEIIYFAKVLIEAHGAHTAESVLHDALLSLESFDLGQVRLVFSDLLRASSAVDATKEFQYAVLSTLWLISANTLMRYESGMRGELISQMSEDEFARHSSVLTPRSPGPDRETFSQKIERSPTSTAEALLLLAESNGPIALVLERMLEITEDPDFLPTATILEGPLSALAEVYPTSSLSRHRGLCGRLVDSLYGHAVDKMPVVVGSFRARGGEMLTKLVHFLDCSGHPPLGVATIQNIAVVYPGYGVSMEAPYNQQFFVNPSTAQRTHYRDLQHALVRMRQMGYQLPEHPDWSQEFQAAILKALAIKAEATDKDSTGKQSTRAKVNPVTSQSVAPAKGP